MSRAKQAGKIIPDLVSETALQFFGWLGTQAMQAAFGSEAMLVITPSIVSAEMSEDDVSRSWIVCFHGRRCIVVERIECHRLVPTETYDTWEEYEG